MDKWQKAFKPIKPMKWNFLYLILNPNHILCLDIPNYSKENIKSNIKFIMKSSLSRFYTQSNEN